MTLRNGRYVVPGQGRGAEPRQGHRPRRVGQRPDPVHRAARRGRARERLARGAGGRGRGDRPHPRRAVGPRRRERRRRCARRSTRWPGSTCGPPRRPSPAEMDATRAETADRPEVILLSARHPGLTGRVIPIDIRIGDGYTALVVTGPEHRRQDRHPAHARPAEPDAPVPACTSRPSAGSRLPIWRDVFADIGDEQSVAQSLSTFSGHLRRITHDRRGGRARTRSSCSTSSAPAPTRPRARRWPRRCSTTSSGPARSSRRRPTTPSSRRTPTRRPGRATPRSSSTSRR